MSSCTSLLKIRQDESIVNTLNSYFNSKIAADLLYETYINKKDKDFQHVAKGKNVKYYLHPKETNGRFKHAKEVSRNVFFKNNRKRLAMVIVYDKNNRVLEVRDRYGFRKFFSNDRQVAVDYTKNEGAINYDYAVDVSCWSDQSCRAYVSKYKESQDMFDLNWMNRKKRLKKLFNDLKKAYKNKRTFVNNAGQKIKTIDYEKQSVSYYFYTNKQIYEVRCGYLQRECRIFTKKGHMGTLGK